MRNIELNFQRLCGLEYSIEKVFRDASYDCLAIGKEERCLPFVATMK